MNLVHFIIGTGFFLSFFILIYFVLGRSTVESALIERVTRQDSGGDGAPAPGAWGSLFSVDRLARPFGFFRSLFGDQPQPVLVRRLMLAGYRKPAHVDLFLGARLAVPAILGITAAFLAGESAIFMFFVAVVVGFFLPDIWLGSAIKKRRRAIQLSLPDALDLLGICLEAGLGLDQAVVRVGEELHISHPELSDEFLHINFELRAGVPRLTAWKGFSDRVDLESVRSFVTMLAQTDRFGTPISKSLSGFSDALRTQRRQLAEERAAKTTIKLVLPLVFFILPEVFIVTVAPAVIIIFKNLGNLAG